MTFTPTYSPLTITKMPKNALTLPITHAPRLLFSASTSQKLLKILANSADANIGRLACRALDDFYSTVGNFLSHIDSKGNTDQIGILELDSGPLVAVVDENVMTRGLKRISNLL